MTWTLETSCGYESAKVASICVPYLQGQVLDIGCGVNKVWPNVIGVDNGKAFGRGRADIIINDAADLSLFANEQMDAVFSSHLLEHFPREQVPNVLKEWSRVLKCGGYLVLYIPSANLYPRIGETGANPDHKWDPMPGDIERILQQLGGWEILESEERSGTNEYSLFVVARKLRGHKFQINLRERNPGGKKRCLIIRYGAIGDQIIVSSVLPQLKAAGYHITYQTTPKGQAILRHDPHIDEWFLQEKDYVPNEQLGEYWTSLEERYDVIFNLCESVEGTLLALPGRMEAMRPMHVRRKLVGGVNYLERTHDLCGMPHIFAPRFYPSPQEQRDAQIERRRMTGPVIAWALHGSSLHKAYPHVDVVALWLNQNTPAHVVFLSDHNEGKVLQDAIMERLAAHGADMRRIHGKAGLYDVREALSFAQQCDVVVGPETGVLNAVSMEAMGKVVMLSHSSADNLCKHWRNARAILPTPDVACYPCHLMHYNWDHCHRDHATGAACCAASIQPSVLFGAIVKFILPQTEAAE